MECRHPAAAAARFHRVGAGGPASSVDGDAAYLRSILDTIKGPIVLVGHSYGGLVMTNAAEADPDVVALVYVAGFAPAAGETVGGLTALNPRSGLLDPANLVVRPHPSGPDGDINPTVFGASSPTSPGISPPSWAAVSGRQTLRR